MLAALEEGVVLHGPDGAITEHNAAAGTILGLASDELIGRMPADSRWQAIHEDGSPFAGDTHPAVRTLATGEPCSGVVMGIRKPDGSLTWIQVNSRPILQEGETHPSAVVVSFFDITEREERSRQRDHLQSAIEESFDGMVIIGRDLRIVYANATAAQGVGHVAADLVGRPITEVAGAVLDPAQVAEMMETVLDERQWTGEVDRQGPEGTPRRVEVRITPTRDERGTISSWIGVIRDVTAEHRGRAALESSEHRLRIALDTMLDGVAIQSAVRDDTGRIVDFRVDYVNAAIGVVSRMAGIPRVGHSLLELLPAHRTNGLFQSYVAMVETGVPFFADGFHYVDPDAAGGPLDQIVDLRAARMGEGYVLSVRDISGRHRAEREMRRLSRAIEQSAESVMITDATGAIEYVNPAFEQVSGYTRDEVLGRNPRLLKSGVQDSAFYAAMWDALTSGQTFVADMTNRRKNGEIYQEESVVSPILDETGTITSYVAVKRDVTRERASEDVRESLARERALIATALSGLHVLPTPAATAAAICRQIVGLAGVASASLAYFTLEGPALALAFVRADGVPVRLRRLPFQRSRVLRERAEEGPWVETWVHRPWHPYDRLHTDLGTAALAYAPVRSGGTLIGLLTVTSDSDDAIERLTETLPGLLEFAGFAGALVGRAVADLTELGATRERIAQIIKSAAFRPVFQPVVELATGARVGYEALTRFADGTAPDLVFADARAAGLEAELELATLAGAIAAATGLPGGAWLSLNASPNLVGASSRLAGLVRRADRPIVLEVTEHVAVADYAALRAALGRLRPKVRVAIDDAGSGIANFSHIVELRPAFVKLDIGLVRGIDTDLTRQALMVGLLHFASESSSLTIAEGVETPEELAMLQALHVPLAQGYLLGRPAPVAEWAETRGITGPGHVPRNGRGARRATGAPARVAATTGRQEIASPRAGDTTDRGGDDPNAAG